jgi:hypothetical protein
MPLPRRHSPCSSNGGAASRLSMQDKAARSSGSNSFIRSIASPPRWVWGWSGRSPQRSASDTPFLLAQINTLELALGGPFFTLNPADPTSSRARRAPRFALWYGRTGGTLSPSQDVQRENHDCRPPATRPPPPPSPSPHASANTLSPHCATLQRPPLGLCQPECRYYTPDQVQKTRALRNRRQSATERGGNFAARRYRDEGAHALHHLGNLLAHAARDLPPAVASPWPTTGATDRSSRGRVRESRVAFGSKTPR